LSHAQYDGISLPALLKDLQAAYEQKPFTSTLVPFSTFIDTVHRSAKTPAETYWHDLLEGSSMTQVVSRSKPSTGNVINQVLTKNIWLPRLPPGITAATVLKACWARTLARLTGCNDIVFGHVTSGRSSAIPEADSIAGPCINIIPIRVRMADRDALRLLEDVQSQALASIPHETMGFRSIIDCCTSWPKWTRFSSVVQHQNLDMVFDGEDSLFFGTNKCRIDAYLPPNDAADVWVYSFPTGNDSLRIDLTFSDRTIDPIIATTMLDLLCELMSNVGDQDHEMPPTAVLLPIKPSVPEVDQPPSIQVSEAAIWLVAQAWNEVFSTPLPEHDSRSADATSSSSASSSIMLDSRSEPRSPSPSSIGSGRSSPLPRPKESSLNTPLTTATTPLSYFHGKQGPLDFDSDTEEDEEAKLEMRLRRYNGLPVDVPFYDISGSLMAAVRLAEVYKAHGIWTDVETLVEWPSMLAQAGFIGERLG
jgi:hypothetical protein